MSSRISRERLFMGVADLYADRATCIRGRVGAVAVRGGRIVATGYNGAPAGLVHCLDEGCLEVNGHCVRAVHAEANLVAWAAREGIPLLGVTLYCTTQPCLPCSKLLVNAGVKTVYYRDDYDGEAMELVEDLGLELVIFDED